MMRVPYLALAASLVLLGCKVKSTPPKDPCNPSPCSEQNRSVCVVENGAARCLCDQGFVSRPSGVCEALTLGNCPEHSGDTAEPDDCMARARPMTAADLTRTQTIDPVGDYDFLKIDAAQNNVYTITVKTQATLLPRIDVFDQGGTWLSGTDSPTTAIHSFKAFYGGLHYVRVSHSPLDPSVATGEYTVALSSPGREDHGDGPQDATSVTAYQVASGTTPPVTNGRFEYTADQDWFVFSGVTGVSYSLAFDPDRLVPSVALYAASDTTTPIWTAAQPTIPFDVPSSGQYYLQLYPPQTAASTTAYAFQFTRN